MQPLQQISIYVKESENIWYMNNCDKQTAIKLFVTKNIHHLNNCDKKDGKFRLGKRFPHAHPSSVPERDEMIRTGKCAFVV